MLFICRITSIQLLESVKSKRYFESRKDNKRVEFICSSFDLHWISLQATIFASYKIVSHKSCKTCISSKSLVVVSLHWGTFHCSDNIKRPLKDSKYFLSPKTLFLDDGVNIGTLSSKRRSKALRIEWYYFTIGTKACSLLF